jgi:hypothetical protein
VIRFSDPSGRLARPTAYRPSPRGSLARADCPPAARSRRVTCADSGTMGGG